MTYSTPESLAIFALLGWFGVGCGTQFADPVTLGTTIDPCLAWTTEDECVADAVHGCRVQPNLVGCLTTDPNCPTHSCRGGDPNVRATGGQTLQLHDEPFRFVGVNNWGIAWAPDGCQIGGFANQDAALARMFDDLVTMHVSVARIWAFQPYAGATGTDYSRFSKVIQYARRANVRLIFVLENGRKDNCSKGEQRDDAWFTSGYASAYDSNALSYPEYVTRLVRNYVNEPTILAWELMHEAGANDFAALDAFVANMSSQIRTIDNYHLISVGVDGGTDGTATSRTDGTPSSYAKLHAHATVDLVDVHNFMDLGSAAAVYPESDTSAEAIARTLSKPVFFGALAISISDDSAATLKLRADGMKTQLDTAFARGFVGALLYEYFPDWSATTSTTFCFDARTTDPLGAPNGVLATAAQKYNLP